MKRQSDESSSQAKKKAKKYRKWVKRGEIWSRTRLAECEAAGVVVHPQIEISRPVNVAGARVPTMKDVGKIVWRVLGCRSEYFCEAATISEARKDWPPWLEVGNAAKLERVMVVCSAGALSEAQVRIRVYEPKHAAYHPDKRAVLDVLLRQLPPWAETDRESEDCDVSLRSVQLDAEVHTIEALYLASTQEMMDNKYPTSVVAEAAQQIPAPPPDALSVHEPWFSQQQAEHLVASFPSLHTLPKEHRKVWGLDCEMVQTARGAELARCTVVDAAGHTALDVYCRPDSPVVDYCTQYSGVDESVLQAIDTTLAQVQATFLSLVGAEDILVGHSLDNDLRVLKIAHTKCADTALLYPHPKGPGYKRSLRHLARDFLKRTIQVGAHDSVVDARTALDLLKLKVQRGTHFGRPTSSCAPTHLLLQAAAALPDTRVAFYSADPRPHARGNVSAICCSSPQRAVSDLTKYASGFHLLVANLDQPLSSHRSLLGALPSDALLILVAQPDIRELQKLDQRKRACADARAAAQWSAQDEERRLELLDNAMHADVAVFAAAHPHVNLA